MLKGCEVRALDERTAWRSGELLGDSGTSDIVDASVVALALGLRALVVTSDPKEPQRLAEAAGEPLHLYVM